MIRTLKRQDLGRHLPLMWSMHRLRHEVFFERMGWQVPTTGEFEVDYFDVSCDPAYVIHQDEQGEVDGCMRLLPTDGPYLLRDCFPQLMGDHPMVTEPDVLEVSRFAVRCPSPALRRRSGASGAIALKLMTGATEYALAHGFRGFVAVADLRMERVLRLAGCQTTRFAAPVSFGHEPAVAVSIPATAEMLAGFHAKLAKADATAAIGAAEQATAAAAEPARAA